MKIMHFVLYVTLSDSLSSDQDSSDDESRAPPAKKRRADDRGMYNVRRCCTYRKQQKFHGTKLSRFSQIFNKTRTFSLLILGYSIS